MKMRCLLLPRLAPLLANSSSKQQARFSLQTLAHTHTHTAPYLPKSLVKYRARRSGKITIIIIIKKKNR